MTITDYRKRYYWACKLSWEGPGVKALTHYQALADKYGRLAYNIQRFGGANR